MPEVSASCLLVERAKFASHVIVRVSLSLFELFRMEKDDRLHLVEERDKINTNYYINEIYYQTDN